MHFFGAEGEAVEGHDIYERYSLSLDRCDTLNPEPRTLNPEPWTLDPKT